MKTITIEDVFAESERLWNTEYDPEVKSENSYCHKQSFKWGFQEGVDYACKMLSNKRREVTYSNETNQQKNRRIDTINIQDCDPKKQPCLLTNHGIETNIIFK